MKGEMEGEVSSGNYSFWEAEACLPELPANICHIMTFLLNYAYKE